MLGVGPSVGNFTSCSPQVRHGFRQNLDEFFHQTQFYVAALLERWKLIYVETYDWICNWIGNERFTLATEWSGKSKFTSQELCECKVGGKTAGLIRSAEDSYDKPAEALELVKRWLANECCKMRSG